METKSLAAHFGELEDPRTGRAKLHNMVEMLVIALCAILAGAEHCVDIALWGETKQDWLKQFLKLENGIPSHDTFSRLFRLLKPKAFEAVFRSWIGGIVGAVKGGVALDGKTLRGSHDGDERAIHLVSAFSTELGLVLGQEKVADKSNEITAIPPLLQTLYLKGCLVSIDAMGCQKSIAQDIRDAGADYLLAVKGNQGDLEESLVNFFDAERCDRVSKTENFLQTIEKARGGIETRRYWLADNVFGLVDSKLWADCRKVGMVESIRDTGEGEPSIERRYFITSAASVVSEFAHAVRDHWHIENRLHWSLDVMFREDECRIRKDYAPQNFSLLRKFGLNLLRMDASDPKMSLRCRRKRVGWNDDFLMTLLGLKRKI